MAGQASTYVAECKAESQPSAELVEREAKSQSIAEVPGCEAKSQPSVEVLDREA